MKAFRKREFKIAITNLIFFLIFLLSIVKIFEAYERNGNGFNSSPLIFTIIITFLFMALPFTMISFFIHLNRGLKARKIIDKTEYIEWTINADDWNEFVIYTSKNQIKDALGLLIKTIKKYGIAFIIVSFISLIFRGFDIKNIIYTTVIGLIILTLIGPVVTLLKLIKTLIFYIENRKLEGNIYLSEKYILLNGTYYNLNNLLIASIDNDIMLIEQIISNNNIDNKIIRIPIPYGKKDEGEYYIKSLLELE